MLGLFSSETKPEMGLALVCLIKKVNSSHGVLLPCKLTLYKRSVVPDADLDTCAGES